MAGPAADTPTWRRVLETVERFPGITKSEIKRMTGLGWGTVSHHVRKLVSGHHVVAVGSLRRVYLYSAHEDPSHFRWMRLLRDDVYRDLLVEIGAHPGTGMQDLSRRLDLSRAVIRRYLADLVDAGLVARSQDYRPRFELTQPGLQGLEVHRGPRPGEATGGDPVGGEGPPPPR